jgi:hypothetical protein
MTDEPTPCGLPVAVALFWGAVALVAAGGAILAAMLLKGEDDDSRSD